MSSIDTKSKSIGAHRKNIGAYFTHFLFPQILQVGKTIEQAFDDAKNRDTSFLSKLFGIKRRTLHYPSFFWQETPQLRW